MKISQNAIHIALLILLWCVASEMTYQDEIAAQVVMVGR